MVTGLQKGRSLSNEEVQDTACEIRCRVLLRTAEGRPFHIEKPTKAKVRCWHKEALDRGTRGSYRSPERKRTS